MRRVRNRGGREILINQDLVTMVEPLPGEEGMVVLHFGRDQRAVVRGTLDDYDTSPHRHAIVTEDPDNPGRWKAYCCSNIMGAPTEELARRSLESHIKGAI